MSKRKKQTEETPAATETLTYERTRIRVYVNQLRASPLNPRRTKPADYDTKLRELADSIARLGVLQPPMVRLCKEDADEPLEQNRTYEVLMGERRWRASLIAAERVPERGEIEVILVDVPDDVAFELAVAENDQRDDMHPIDQCDAFVRMRREGHASVAKIAAIVGRTEQYVYSRLRLEQLTPDGRAALVEGRISLGVAEILARISATSQDATLRKLAARFDTDIPLWAAREEAKRQLHVLADAPFDTQDASLHGGACAACPKRSEAQQQLFGDLIDDDRANTNRCTDPSCWGAKVDEHWTRTAERARERGLTVADEATARKICPTPYGPTGGYVDLDAPSHADPTKTWREELASREGLTVTLVRDPNGKAIEVASLGQIERAEREAERARRAASDAAMERDRHVAALTRARLRDAIASTLALEHNRAWDRKGFWRSFALIVIGWWDESDLSAEERRRHGLGEEPADSPGAVVELRARVAAMKDTELLALSLDLLIGGLNLMSAPKPSEVEAALLEALSIDHKAIARVAAKDARAQAKSRGAA